MAFRSIFDTLLGMLTRQWMPIAITVCLTLGAFAPDAMAAEPTGLNEAAATVDVEPQHHRLTAEFTQVDNFVQACQSFLFGCYYCCLGCGDLGLGIGTQAAVVESPVPPPVARAQAY